MKCDETLIHEVLNGNKGAVNLLAKKYYKPIFAYVYRNIGEKQTSYDITQEVFIKIIKNLKSFKGNFNKLKYWMFKIASNTCKDYYRSSYYKNNNNNIKVEDNMIVENNVEEILLKNERREIVKSALLNLSPQQRETLILRFYHDFKIKDIASITDANEATVKSRIRQGIQKLKKYFEGGEEGEYKEQCR